MLRLSLPIVGSMTWKMGMPFMMKRGFGNLLKMAETRAARVSDQTSTNG
jgi:hypothetical protein